MAATAIERPRFLPISKTLPKRDLSTKTTVSVPKGKDDNVKIISLHTSNEFNSLDRIRSQNLSLSNLRFSRRMETRSGKSSADLEAPSKVKPAALLYEITERTNQLAQPRNRSTIMNLGRPQLNAFRIREVSGRVLELSKPKTIPQFPLKTPGYVAPSALTAVPTQRIIELSRPRKQIRLPSPKKKRLVYESCSPRLTYLSCPRQATLLEKTLKSFLTSSDSSFKFEDLQDLENWSSQTTGIRTRHQGRLSESMRQPKTMGKRRLRRKRIKKHLKKKLGTSISNRTVISIDLKPDKNQIAKKPKQARKSKRRKSYKSKTGH